MKKGLLILGAVAMVIGSSSCLIKSRVCNCTYVDGGVTYTTEESYVGGALGTSKKQQQTSCDNYEASLASSYTSANCELN